MHLKPSAMKYEGTLNLSIIKKKLKLHFTYILSQKISICVDTLNTEKKNSKGNAD